MPHHFISYSQPEASEFAIRLVDELGAGPPSIRAWLDQREIKPGQDWDEQIDEAIKTSESLLFVMTRDSVAPTSVCKQEWIRALKYKKPVIPLRLHRDAELPFRLEPRQYIDFSGELPPALARLRKHLLWLATPDGAVETLRARLADAERDLRRAAGAELERVQQEIQLLRKQLAEQEEIVKDPEAAARRAAESIARALERERLPEKPAAAGPRARFINPPPAVAPAYFQDRHVETKLVGDFVKDENLRLMTVVGRAGIGKTAMVCRLLRALERGLLPDDGGLVHVDGIVYLSAAGSHHVNFPTLFADLLRLLPDQEARGLEAAYKDAGLRVQEQVTALLAAFPAGRIVVLLDNFEDLVDPETLEIRDAEMNEALRTLLEVPHHAVKTILTTRFAPRRLALVQPGRQARLELDRGLESPYAENILREMDADGTIGLKSAPAAMLAQARQRTRGFPRALEALFAILAADRYTSLQELLEASDGLLPENVVEALVGQAFNRLDPTATRVIQALAVFGRPVSATGIDYVLQPYVQGINSAPVLNRLVSMQFARKEGGIYYLHPVDRAYAFGTIAVAESPGGQHPNAPLFVRGLLTRRAADYFKEVRKPREDWKSLEDLGPQLAEFDLRCANQEYDTAAQVLLEIERDYLALWGHFRLITDLFERLHGKLADVGLRGLCASSLAAAYGRTGQLEKGMASLEEALACAQETRDEFLESSVLGSIGFCYVERGDTARSIEFFNRGLDIARRLEFKSGQAYLLGGLAKVYEQQGDLLRAIELRKQMLAMHRELNEREDEAITLGNLGEDYCDLANVAEALEYCQASLRLARDIGSRLMECAALMYLADLHSSQDHLESAVELYEQAIRIADEIAFAQVQNEARVGLALAYLYQGNLPLARAAAEAAQKHGSPQNRSLTYAALGLITLRQGDRNAARLAFYSAVAGADRVLERDARAFTRLDEKALALCGLAICEDRKHLPAAIEAFRAARAINQYPGVVRPVQQMLDALGIADPAGLLAGVKEIAAGSEARATGGG